MTALNEQLRASDPLGAEPSMPAARRDAMRRTVLSAAARHASRDQPRPRRAVLLAFAAMAASAVAVVGMAVLSPDEGVVHAAMQFEVRLAETDARQGTRAVSIGPEGRTIFVRPDAVLTNDDIAATRVVGDRRPYAVEVELTPRGAERLRRATAAHLGRPVAIMVDGAVLAAPVVRSPIDRVGQITGDYSKEDAERLAQGLERP